MLCKKGCFLTAGFFKAVFGEKTKIFVVTIDITLKVYYIPVVTTNITTEQHFLEEQYEQECV